MTSPLHLARAIHKELRGNGFVDAPYQWGVVNAIHTGPNTVDLYLDGSSTLTPSVRYLASYYPTVGDVVKVDRFRSDRVVVGTLANGTTPIAGLMTPGVTPGNPQTIPSGADLDTYTTAGFYAQPSNTAAAAGSNYPEPLAGTLVVLDWSSTGVAVMQVYYRYTHGTAPTMYLRSLYSGTWSAWFGGNGAINFVGNAGQPAFQNGWTNYGGNFGPVGFSRGIDGTVCLQGVAKSGTISSTAAMFTLPAGYCPAAELILAVSASGLARLDVTPAGNVIAYSGATGYWALDGVQFVVA